MFRSSVVSQLARQSARLRRNDSIAIINRLTSTCPGACSRACMNQLKQSTDHQDTRSLSSSCFRFQKLTSKAKSGPEIDLIDHQYLNITWEDGEAAVYPLVWMRYNCKCTRCLHPISLGRRLLGRDMQMNPQIDNIETDLASQAFTVEWDDGHISTFGFDWLKERSFSEHRIAKREADLQGYRMRCAWGNFFQPAVLDFNESLRTDKGLIKLITMLKVYGLVFLKNAAGEDEPLNELAEKFGYTIPHNYGHFFQVKSRPDPSNNAWTSETLGLHIDNVFYTDTPGIQALHCIRQTSDIEGGENQFADGMFAARRIRREDRRAFQLLKEEKVNFWDYGSDYVQQFHLRTCRPVFTLDENDELIEMAYNHQVQDSRMIIAPEKIPEWFRAMYLLEKTLNEEAVHWRLEPGQIVIFDNLRVLHGRNGYKMTNENSERYLRGGFLSWDETNSLYRRLKEKEH